MSDPAQAGEIFISYSSKDRERVRILVDALVRQGVTVWWDQHIVAGQNWENEIEKALHRSRAVIVLWSQHSVASDEVKEEANYARSQGKLIPVRLDGTLIPFRYLRTQTPDLSSWDGAEDHPVFHELLAAVAGRPVPERVRGGPDKASRRASRISRAWLVLPALLIGVIAAGLAGLMLRRTPSEVQAGVARVSVDPKLGRQPGTAFVVAVSGQTAFLVTCAHVVVEESSPRVEFRAAPLREFRATVRAREPGDNPRGLALLEVQNVPHEVQALPLAASANPVQGERLSVAGFSGPSSRFLILDMILAGDEGQDLTLSRETEAGFSGGPVLRGDSAIGIIYGREAGGYGTALISDVVRAYLRGLKVPLDGGPRTTQPSAQPPAAPQPGDTRVNPVSGLKDVWIPPGTFTMGCSEGDTECRESEKPGHPVTITKGFWMSQTEVTVGAYKRYVIATGKSMPPEPAFLGTAFNPGWEDMAQPILNVSFQEAAAY
ncbi:MAG: TIR domain-containing protein [Bryobacterales bacterium]|nr:TIR domain-containing protein [Bryobacterales bacterium]